MKLKSCVNVSLNAAWNQLYQSFWEGLNCSSSLKTNARLQFGPPSALEMSLLSVCVRGEWLRVPRGGPSTSVHALGVSALRRYRQARGGADGEEEKVRFSVQRCCSGELLHPDDKLGDVLGDTDFVQIGACHPSTSDG